MFHVLRTRAVRGVTAAAATVLLAFSAPASFAHDLVIGGNPDNEETVAEFPTVIELEFSGYIKEDFNTFAVSDVASGEILFSGEPNVEGRLASLTVPEGIDPGDGDYQIGFQITSADGHSTRGMTTFTVGEGDAAPAATDRGAGQPEDNGGESAGTGLPEGPLTWVLAGVGILAVLGVIVMMIARGRHTTQE
ncbi:copper resistance CopC family protein [Corynebacterium comes]|uniref:CopC domain-containing protein n=1 Tax=Corynebacterium comes TaxID=2675218 RepID=A0A6B8W4G7_9CORY|nr:copper resistance protein CopC [Corynebacterium comes]QGU04760.1 hypothetical protein CETAM_07495 [Corynebacterium comes]